MANYGNMRDIFVVFIVLFLHEGECSSRFLRLAFGKSTQAVVRDGVLRREETMFILNGNVIHEVHFRQFIPLIIKKWPMEEPPSPYNVSSDTEDFIITACFVVIASYILYLCFCIFFKDQLSDNVEVMEEKCIGGDDDVSLILLDDDDKAVIPDDVKLAVQKAMSERPEIHSC